MDLEKTLLQAKNIEVRQVKTLNVCPEKEAEAQFKEAFMLTDKTIDSFEMLPEYKEIIGWLSDNKGKGLFMTGSVGRGKTTILRGVLPLLFLANLNKIITVYPARELHKFDYKKWLIAIDDMGQDDVVKDFGTSVNAVEDAISYAEDHMKLLLITSNLTRDQIKNKYGERIMSRIERLCKIVVFKGSSKRK